MGRKMNDLKIVGKPDVCVVAFDAAEGSGLNCYAIGDCMKKKFQWDLATCQNPPCIHLALTLPTAKNADKFLAELQEAIDIIRNDKGTYASTAGVYGSAAAVPSQFVEIGVAAYLDAMTETT